MISKSEIKFITSLRQKKYRDQHGLFVAEGPKVVEELLSEDFKLHSFFSVSDQEPNVNDVRLVSTKELERISSLKSPNECLAVFYKPELTSYVAEGLIVVLDAVRDPGNLGTIIRLCDWFGISQIWCSEDTADCYNPKVVQATMGSIARIQLRYCNLEETLKHTSQVVYGAVMDGENVYDLSLSQNAFLVLGNESHGISESVLQLLQNKITIPRYGNKQQTESLNVATAAAILLGEFRRQAIER